MNTTKAAALTFILMPSVAAASGTIPGEILVYGLIIFATAAWAVILPFHYGSRSKRKITSFIVLLLVTGTFSSFVIYAVPAAMNWWYDGQIFIGGSETHLGLRWMTFFMTLASFTLFFVSRWLLPAIVCFNDTHD